MEQGGHRGGRHGVPGKQTLPIETSSAAGPAPGKESLAARLAPSRGSSSSESGPPGTETSSPQTGEEVRSPIAGARTIGRLQLGDVRAAEDPGRRALLAGVEIGPENQVPGRAPAAIAREATQSPGGALPFADKIQRSFGRHDLSGVRAHAGAAAAKGSRELGAQAFAAGDDIAFDGAPSLHTAAHEAAHVVQQRGGAPGVQGLGRADGADEEHADAVADRVVRGESAEKLLDTRAGDRTARPTTGGVHLLRIEPNDQRPGAKSDVGPFTPAETFRRDHVDGYNTDALSRVDLVRLQGMLRAGAYQLVDAGLQARLVTDVDARIAAPPAPPTVGSGGVEVKDGMGPPAAPSGNRGVDGGLDVKRGSSAADGSPVRFSQVLAGSAPAPAPTAETPATTTARNDLKAVEAKLETPASTVAQGGGYFASAASAIYTLGGYAAWLGVGRLFLEPILKLAIRRIFGVDVPRLDLSFGLGFARINALDLGSFSRGGATVGSVALQNVGFRFDAEALDRAFWAADPSLLGQGMIVVEVGSLRVRNLSIVRNATPLTIQIGMTDARFLGTHANLMEDLVRVAESAFQDPIDPASVERGLQSLLRDNLQGAFQIQDLDVTIAGDLQRAATGQGGVLDVKHSPSSARAHITGLHGAAVGRGSREDRPEAQIGFGTAELTASGVPVRHGDAVGRASGRLAVGPTTVVHSGAVRPNPRALAPQAGGAPTTAVNVGEINADRMTLAGGGQRSSLDALQIGPSRAEVVGNESAHAEIGGIRAGGAVHQANSNEREGDLTTQRVDSARLADLDVAPLAIDAKRDRAGEHATISGGATRLVGLDVARSHETHGLDEKEADERLSRDAMHAHVDRLDVGTLRAEAHRRPGGSVDGDVKLASLGVRGADAELEREFLHERSHQSAGIGSLDLAALSAAGTAARTPAGLGIRTGRGQLGHFEAHGVTGRSPEGHARLDHAVLEGARGAFTAGDADRKEPVGPSGELALGRLRLDGISAATRTGDRKAHVAHLGVAPTAVSHSSAHSRAHLGAISARGVALDAESRTSAGGEETALHDALRLGALDIAPLDARSDAKGDTRRSQLDGGATTLRGIEAHRGREVSSDEKRGGRVIHRGADQLRVDELGVGALHARVDRDDDGAATELGVEGAHVRGVRAEGDRRHALYQVAPPKPSLTAGEIKLGAVNAQARPGADPQLDVGALDVDHLDVQTSRARLALQRGHVGATRATLGENGLAVNQGGVRAGGLDARVADPNIEAERVSTTQLEIGRLTSAGTDITSTDGGSSLTQRGLAVERLHLNQRNAHPRGTDVTDVNLGDAKLAGTTLATDGDGTGVNAVTPGAISAREAKYQSNDDVLATLTSVTLDVPSGGDGSATVQGTARLPVAGDQKLSLTLPIHGGQVAMRDVSTSNVQSGHRFLVGTLGKAMNIRVEDVKHQGGVTPGVAVSIANVRVVTKTLADLGITPAQQAAAPVLSGGNGDPGRVNLLTLIMHRVQTLVTNAVNAVAPVAPPTTLAESKERKLVAKLRALIALLRSRVTVRQAGAAIGGLKVTDQTASRDAKDDNPAAFADTLHVIASHLELGPTEVLTRLGVDPEYPSPHAMTLLLILEDLARTLDDVLRGTPR